MSRTTRRKAQFDSRRYLGTFGEFKGLPWMYDNAERKGLTLRELFDLNTRQFHMDRDGEGRRNPPYWYRREQGSLRVRQANKRMLHRHLEYDTFDAHLPEQFVPRCGVYFWL